MEQAIFDKTSKVMITGDDKSHHDGNCQTYLDKTAQPDKHIGKALKMIVGQCPQRLLYIMKQDINWETVSIYYDKLAPINIINKVCLAQTEDQYPSTMVYEQ